jgi:hypothetical protein
MFSDLQVEIIPVRNPSILYVYLMSIKVYQFVQRLFDKKSLLSCRVMLMRLRLPAGKALRVRTFPSYSAKFKIYTFLWDSSSTTLLKINIDYLNAHR